MHSGGLSTIVQMTTRSIIVESRTRARKSRGLSVGGDLMEEEGVGERARSMCHAVKKISAGSGRGRRSGGGREREIVVRLVIG